MDCFAKGHHLHLIDASGFLFRAYHALPPLTRPSDGLPVGAVHGFCNMIFKLIEDHHGPDAPTHVGVIFDHSGKTFRNDLYEDYKANRPPAPEDLVVQMPLVRRAAEAFGLCVIEQEGYEADDIIATLATQAREAGARVSIISSDKDLMQLVGGGVELVDPMRNVRIGPEEVEKKFGVPPEKVVDVQALAGDSVDNIPGAPGIGIKTAALLIREYGDLDNLLAHAEEIPQPKRRETLMKMADQIRLSRELVRLKTDMPIEVDCECLEVREPDPEKLLGFLAEMEFRTLTKRIASRLGVEPPPIPEANEAGEIVTPEVRKPFDPKSYRAIRSAEDLAPWLERIRDRGYFAIDTETTSLDEMKAELVGISLATEAGEAAYIPLAHVDGDDDLLGGGKARGQMDMEECLQLLRPILEDPSILKIGQNIKYDLKVLRRYGCDFAPIDDTMLLSHSLHSGLHGHGMDYLSERYLDHKPISIKPLLGSGKSARTFDKVPVEQAIPYAAEDADITFRLWEAFKPLLHRNRVTTVYETLERPLVPLLADMEMVGIKVDRQKLADLSTRFAQRMAELEDEIYQLAGRKFNIASPKQLGEILFEEMGLAGGKRGKTGAYGTSMDVLEDLAAEGHELPARVLDWRQLAKLKSTYTDALQAHIDPETGRVHTSYSIAGASTGRLASTDPNLQNIPTRTEEGRRIREAFIAEEGHLLLSLDYSQIELRVLAHVAEVKALREAFAKGLDIHAATAAEIFGIPLEEVTPEIRRRAKAVNFGVIYGISAFGLARNLRIPREEAQQFIDHYFERFPEIRDYMDRTIDFAKEHGFVTTLFGRKIHTPQINARGPHAGFAKRAAINAPLQGTAADIILRAMIRVPEAIEGLPARMLLQVHDELIFEVAEEAVDETRERVRKVMESSPLPVVKLAVPLVVDAGVGRNWAEAH